MEKVPTEILHKIFILLCLHERIACTLVCRQWYDILSQRSLLYNLDISDDFEFERLEHMLESFPSRRLQVDELKLMSCLPANYDRRVLFDAFPNLRKISVLLSAYEDCAVYYDHSDQFEFKNPKSKLVKIRDDGACELTCGLAASNLCGRLKSLDIFFIGSLDLDRTVIHKLKNMPVLEKLKLRHCGVSLTDLEVIHSNIPSLKTLIMDEVSIAADRMPSDIQPATSITKINLCFHEINNLQEHIRFYQYISMKYQSVTSFDVSDMGMGRCKPQSRYLKRLFEEGVFSVFQTIGPQLRKLPFKVLPEGLDVYKRLNDFGFKLKDTYFKLDRSSLPAFTYLAQSEQSKHIKELYLQGWVPDATDLLKEMTSIKTLVIDDSRMLTQSKETINLSPILDVCQTTLSRLTVRGFGYITVLSVPFYTTAITYLKLDKIDLTDTLATVISQCFPKLEYLTIQYRIFNNVTISLPKNHLKTVFITAKCGTLRYGIEIITLDDSKTQYHATKGDSKMSNDFVPVSESECDDALKLKLICASIDDLYLRSNFDGKYSIFRF